jgi:large subunit ribosomal protein L3
MILRGKKLKMEQIYIKDEAIGVTPIKVHDNSDLSQIKVGDLLNVSGIIKGRGFQGVVKRHGFHGGPKTHGQKNRYRAPGSIGNTSPQRTLPGRRMAGHMGAKKTTIKNLEVVSIDSDQKIIFLRGSIPGNNSGKVEIYK